MKKDRIRLVIIIFSGIIMAACSKETKVVLFNGEDLSNWNSVLFDSTANAAEVFQVKEGIIHVSGKPNAYIITKESYSNYKLHVEWRWAAEPVNSGVLLHCEETGLEWPLCIEAQLMHSNAGDIVLIGLGAGASVGDSTYIIEPEERRYEIIKKLEESSEKPAGEWNVYDITCEGDNIELIVNGIVQNIASEASLNSGPIALQSEGAPIEFRNITLVPLGN